MSISPDLKAVFSMPHCAEAGSTEHPTTHSTTIRIRFIFTEDIYDFIIKLFTDTSRAVANFSLFTIHFYLFTIHFYLPQGMRRKMVMRSSNSTNRAIRAARAKGW